MHLGAIWPQPVVSTSSAVCRRDRPLSSLFRGQELTTCWQCLDVGRAPQSHISLSIRPHFFRNMRQWPCPFWKRFSNDHWHRGRCKPRGRTVESFTSEKLITVADYQSSHHRLDTEAVVSAENGNDHSHRGRWKLGNWTVDHLPTNSSITVTNCQSLPLTTWHIHCHMMPTAWLSRLESQWRPKGAVLCHHVTGGQR